MFIWSGGDSLVVFGGSSASCRLSAGVGMAAPEAGAGAAVVEVEGVDTLANAYNCTCCAWRAAARSALALSWTILARDFSSRCTLYDHRRHLEQKEVSTAKSR